MPPATPPFNGFSVASLVTGIVCCLPPLGLVFGLVALAQIKRKGQRGRGMALAGTILSSISTVLAILLLATGMVSAAWDGFQEGMDETARSRSTMDLAKGDCLNLPGDGAPDDEKTASVDVVDCASGHEAEISGGFPITGFTTYPGAKPIGRLAEERCRRVNDAYAMDDWKIPWDMGVYFYMPTEESWRLGDRDITCGFATIGGDKVKGSLRSDATNLNPPQLAYLKAETAIAAVMDSGPEAEFTEDPVGNRDWARRASAALAAQADALRAGDWPKGAAGPVAERAAEFDRARAHWLRAAKAWQEDVFQGHTAKGEKTLERETETSVRRQLGLDLTAQPEDTSAV